MSINFFKRPDEIMVFVKGHKDAQGYVVYSPKQDKEIHKNIDSSNLYQTVSEFFALNEAIKVLNSGKYKIIHIYTNLELIKDFINGAKKPNNMQHYVDEFKSLTKNTTVTIKWIRNTNSNSNKKSDVQNEEEKFAKEKLEELSNDIKNFKKFSP